MSRSNFAVYSRASLTTYSALYLKVLDHQYLTAGLAGGQAIVLAHVRRWKSDAVFFKQLKKRFEVVDITAEIHLDAAQLSSHTRGALRLFLLHHK